MKKTFFATLTTLFFILTITFCAYADNSNPKVTLETSLGNIVIELYPKVAPKTVKNFLDYVKSQSYNNTIFHRVIKGFMIQGGGLTADMSKKDTKKPIINEADNGLKNAHYFVAMARTNDPNSATSQFFINTKNNSFLNHKNKTPSGWGYCVFGKVIKGMKIVDKIENIKTGIKKGRRDVPIQPVIIKKAMRL